MPTSPSSGCMPPGENWRELGERAHQRHLELARKHPIEALGFGPENAFPDGHLQFAGDSAEICIAGQSWQYEAGRCKFAEATERMRRQNQELLARYLHVRRLRLFHEPYYAGGILWSRDLISLCRLSLSDIDKQLGRNDISLAAKSLVEEISFWRAMMDGEATMITRVVFRVGLNLTLHFASSALAKYPGLIKHADFTGAASPGVARNARSHLAMFDREFANRYAALSTGELLLMARAFPPERHEILGRFLDLFHKPNATRNLDYEKHKAYFGAYLLDGPGFAGVLTTKSEDCPFTRWAHLIDNPVGRLTICMMGPRRSWLESNNFFGSEALLRAVRLQAMIIERRLRDAEIEDFLRNAGPDLMDPYTGKPVIWDAATRVLRIDGFSGSKFDRTEVSVPKV